MSFTPKTSAVGALFIHLASTNHYAQLGQTIGFSSVLRNVAFLRLPDIAIVLGMISSAILFQEFAPQFIPELPSTNGLENSKFLLDLVKSIPFLSSNFEASFNLNDAFTIRCLVYSVAGILVGMGTKFGCGCTSGHMIGGLSRLRVRSLAAVMTFSAAAMLVVKKLGLGSQAVPGVPNYYIAANDGDVPGFIIGLLIFSAVLVYGVLPRIKAPNVPWVRLLYSLFNGFLFGVGLHVSGMLQSAKTLGFLSLLTPEQFDPSLIMIVLFAIVPNIFVWKSIKRPYLTQEFKLATANGIDGKFLLGNLMFGLGWGLLGVCPGPGIIDSWYFPDVRYTWLVSFFVGNLGGALFGGIVEYFIDR